MTTLGEELPNEINRVRALQDQYKAMRSMPNVIVEPQIAAMERDIRAAIGAADVIEMLRAYSALKEWSE